MKNRRFRLALVGTGSLRGKELINILSEKPFPQGEAKVISVISPRFLKGLDVVFLASS